MKYACTVVSNYFHHSRSLCKPAVLNAWQNLELRTSTTSRINSSSLFLKQTADVLKNNYDRSLLNYLPNTIRLPVASKSHPQSFPLLFVKVFFPVKCNTSQTSFCCSKPQDTESHCQSKKNVQITNCMQIKPFVVNASQKLVGNFFEMKSPEGQRKIKEQQLFMRLFSKILKYW